MGSLVSKVLKRQPGLSPTFPGSRQFTGITPAGPGVDKSQQPTERGRRGRGRRQPLGPPKTPLTPRPIGQGTY